ncbi:MAG: hypothetical protein KBB88_00475 [Candidatus Pacebacteria bacterium]|nr:hypothetical protein [Candidatus Paceibacterota bacterium]
MENFYKDSHKQEKVDTSNPEKERILSILNEADQYIKQEKYNDAKLLYKSIIESVLSLQDPEIFKELKNKMDIVDHINPNHDIEGKQNNAINTEPSI